MAQTAVRVTSLPPGALSGQLAEPSAHPEPSIVVTQGEGVIRAAPDRAYVSFATEARAKSPQEAQRQNARAMDAVQKRLREAKIPADAIRTLAYEVQPEFDFHEGRQTLRGYFARNAIEVRVDDVTRVGEIVDRAVGSGAAVVSALRFDLKERDSLEREALRRAVADARARAEAAAAGAGRSIDRVLRVEEDRAPSHAPRPMMMMSRAAEMGDVPSTPVAPGELELRAQVRLTAALK